MRPSLKHTRDEDDEEEQNDDANSTLCLNCAFVAANCVVADETANMVMVFVTTTTMRAGVQKTGIFKGEDLSSRRFCLG